MDKKTPVGGYRESSEIERTPSFTAFRRKNALQAIQVKTPKLKPTDCPPQTKHGSSVRGFDEVISAAEQTIKDV